MAAPNQTPSYAGQANLSGASDALFLKVFSGEVLTAFRENNVFADRTMTRNITSGKSSQFPATWRTTASYHTPGNWILGSQIAGNERVITIDDLLVSPVFIASIDEAKSHFEFRSEYSYQCGAALARAYDQNLARVGVLAARASATVTGGDGGSQIVAVGSRTDADTLIQAIADAVRTMDEKYVPATDRFIYLKPQQYYLLVNSGSKAIHRDYTATSNGGVDTGEIDRLFGAKIVMTNNLPVVDSTSDATVRASYQVNAANTTALVMQRGAVGTVKLMDLATEMDYQVETQGTLIVSKYAVGQSAPPCRKAA